MADVDFEEAAPWHCFQPERPKRAACSCCNCAHCGTDEGRQRIQTDGRAGPPRRPHRSEGRACPAPQATTRDPARRPCAHGPRVPSPAHVAAHAPPASPSAAPAPDRALDRRAARPARLPRRSPPGILRRLQDLQRLLDHLPELGVGLAGQLLGYAPDLKGALPDLCQTRTAATSILRSLSCHGRVSRHRNPATVVWLGWPRAESSRNEILDQPGRFVAGKTRRSGFMCSSPLVRGERHSGLVPKCLVSTHKPTSSLGSLFHGRIARAWGRGACT